MANEKDEENVDPCTGFSTTHKAKLSIPNISWARPTRSGSNPKETSISINEPDLQKRLSSIASSSSPKDGDNKYYNYYGLFFAICSAFMFSINALAAKSLLNHINPFNLGIQHFLFMTLVSGSTICYELKVRKKSDIFESISSRNNCNILSFLFVRALTGVFAPALFVYSVKYLSVGDVTTVDSISPVFIYTLAFLFFGENFGIVPIVTAIMAISGTALIMKPPILVGESEISLDRNILIGVSLSLLEMICAAGLVVSLKFLENVHHAVVNLSFGILGVLQCTIAAWISGSIEITLDPTDGIKMLFSGMIFYAAQTLLTLALQYENAGPVGLLGSTEVVFGFLWQLLFFGMVMDSYRLFGIFLIILAAFFTITKKWITSPDSDDCLDRCQSWLY